MENILCSNKKWNKNDNNIFDGEDQGIKITSLALHNKIRSKIIENPSFLENNEVFNNFEKKTENKYFKDLSCVVFKEKGQDIYLFTVFGNLRYVSRFCNRENVEGDQAFRNLYWNKQIEENEEKGKFLWGVAAIKLGSSEYQKFPGYFNLSHYIDRLSKNYSVSLISVITFSVKMEKGIKESIGILRNHYKKKFVIDSALSKMHTIEHLTNMGIIEDENNCFFVENCSIMPPVLIERVLRENRHKIVVFYNKNRNLYSYIPHSIEKIELEEDEIEKNPKSSTSVSKEKKCVPHNKVFVISSSDCCNFSSQIYPAIGFKNYLGLGLLSSTSFFSQMKELLHKLEEEKNKGCSIM